MNIRRITDAELINELARRGYVVRRNHAPRAISVEHGADVKPNWQHTALETIRGKLSLEHVDFEKMTSANEIEMNVATLRIL